MRVGDILHSPDGDAAVLEVMMEVMQSAYHPFVRSGAYDVDGHLASDYKAHVPAATWALVRKHVAMRYDASMPVVPEGHGLITAGLKWRQTSVRALPHGPPQPTWRRCAPLRSPERSPGRLGGPRGANEHALTRPRHMTLLAHLSRNVQAPLLGFRRARRGGRARRAAGLEIYY